MCEPENVHRTRSKTSRRSTKVWHRCVWRPAIAALCALTPVAAHAQALDQMGAPLQLQRITSGPRCPARVARRRDRLARASVGHEEKALAQRVESEPRRRRTRGGTVLRRRRDSSGCMGPEMRLRKS